ncbi:MAG: hypothetical protein KJO07_10345 [Deltaproteobacteria bacterium]|nr:hypothetical protein [Deltaproteobacteria bacterium]
MGFFDKLFGGGQKAARGQQDTAVEPAPPRAPDFQRRAQSVDWDWDSPQARALTHEILQAAAPAFQPAQIKEVPDDENIDLRGSFSGSPVRFAVWLSFGTFWAIEMLAQSPIAHFAIERDHEKIPKLKEAHDPWSQQEEQRIFVGKGIFFEGYDDDIAARLALWAQMPPGLQQRVVHDLEALDARTLSVVADRVMLSQTPGFSDLPDPIGYMQGCAALLATVRDWCTQGANPQMAAPPQMTQLGGVGPGARMTCSYCSSLFILSAASNTCPNCGAPAQAA